MINTILRGVWTPEDALALEEAIKRHPASQAKHLNNVVRIDRKGKVER